MQLLYQSMQVCIKMLFCLTWLISFISCTFRIRIQCLKFVSRRLLCWGIWPKHAFSTFCHAYVCYIFFPLYKLNVQSNILPFEQLNSCPS
jgi:hypothetical protein